MLIGKNELVVDSATKFNSYLWISGWLKPEKGKLTNIRATSNATVLAQNSVVGIDHGGVLASLGKGLGFQIQVLLQQPYSFQTDLSINFEFSNQEMFTTQLSDLIQDRIQRYESYNVGREFNQQIRNHDGAKVLDLGGRSRSKLDRSTFFPGVNYTVVDILPGENVDVVADAHNLSNHFQSNTFDYIVSTSVFEHLSMPWKVALEMNRVMKMGGKAMIQTHQSIGMHDLPWDFFRFSDAAWDGIFNPKSGFRIVKRVLDHENYVLPFIIRPDQINAEKSAGFEVSLVVVEKISETQLSWEVNQNEIISSSYPSHEDGNDPKLRELLVHGIAKVRKLIT